MRPLDLLHRWTGGLIGLVLAMLGLSGAILVHRDAWIGLPHAGDVQVQGADALSAAVERIMTAPDRPGSIIFATPGFGLDRLSYQGGRGAYADQSGHVVASWQSQWERPELWLFDFHHHLFSGDAGEWVIGIAGICGMFFVVSGVILWWRTRKTWEFRLLPKRLSRPAIVRHHRDLGIMVAPLLLLSLFTGTAMVFRPVIAIILGPDAPSLVARTLKPPKTPAVPLAARPDWRAMIRTARERFPDAELRILALPRKDGGAIMLRMRQPGEWLPNGRTTLWFAADSGRLIEARDALAMPARVRVYNNLYPLHAAKVGGLGWKLAMTLSGLALFMLGTLAVWSFWFKRGKAAPAKRRPALAGQAAK